MLVKFINENNIKHANRKNILMFKNNILIQNLIPCLDDNDVPCFYDSVNKQTHYNRGSGDFLYELL